MCGFVGLFSNEQLTSNDIETLKIMNNAMEHRGPNDESYYIEENIFLGFRRLSIIDLDNGRQPFTYDNENYALLFNGEIYNYIELRDELIKEGLEFETDCEAEVVLALYKYKGKDFVQKLRGMFSIVIWDKQNQSIFGFRDPFGIKPFFYVENEKGLFFGSEMKSFLYNSDINCEEVDIKSLHDYMTFQYVPEPNTMLKNVHILNAGCTIEKKLNEPCKINRYFSPDFTPKTLNQDKKIKMIKDVITDSVAMHMRSDVPVGSFLSGGIDSTIVTYLASKINPNLKSFTVGFEVNGYSEMELAKRSAELFGIENISKSVTCEEFITELPKIIWHMDSPVADPSSIPIYFISKEARKHVTVILSGEGADELFGGYTIYHEPISLKMFDHVPKSVKNILKHIASICPEGVKGKSFIERGCTPLRDRYVGNANIFRDNEKADYIAKFNQQYRSSLVTKPFYDAADKQNQDLVTQMQYIDINTWLKGDILTKSDRMSMANSLELRVPFLDKEVFKVASQLSLEDKISHNTTKYLLREAFLRDFPDEIRGRRKLGYPVPIRVWLKDEIYDWAVNTVKESTADEFINKVNILKMIEDHRKGVRDYSRKIWTMLTFIIWHRLFIEEKVKEYALN